MPTETLYTWESLGTFSGATAATLLIVQYLKLPLDSIRHIPTRLVAFAVSLLIQVCVRLSSPTPWSWQEAPLLALNAVLVSLSAMGAYETTFAKSDAAKGAGAGG